jgi:haloalkane dehalogenase
MPDRVRSLTVVDTIVEPHAFRKPWSMRPFQYRCLGEMWLRATPRPAFRMMMRRIGLAPGTSVTKAEIDVHHRLLRREDDGAAFLKIMRAFETTDDKSRLYAEVLGHGRPIQVLWAEGDTALPIHTAGRRAAELANLPEPEPLPGRHFAQRAHAPCTKGPCTWVVTR